jgi:hypothetical protein
MSTDCDVVRARRLQLTVAEGITKASCGLAQDADLNLAATPGAPYTKRSITGSPLVFP